jgi:hypothetical protein
MYLLRYASGHMRYRPHQAIGMDYLSPTCSNIAFVDMTPSECCHTYDKSGVSGVTYVLKLQVALRWVGLDSAPSNSIYLGPDRVVLTGS